MKDGKSFFIDTTLCIACRGCQVACKGWNRLAGELSINRGGPQNPPDFNSNTWKLVRFRELGGEKLRWYFFSDQCRHCIDPACKEAADKRSRGAIGVDEATGSVLFNPEVGLEPADFEEIRKACPYDVPRFDAVRSRMVFCNMCIDRVHAGLLPACVKTCPTRAMNFGGRKAMLKLARKRLAEAEKIHGQALLTDPDSTRVIYLLVSDPRDYHEFAVANRGVSGVAPAE